MVSTRSHPSSFPPPSPSKSRNSERWAHNPTALTLIWLFVSLPAVTWDTFYIFLRPHSMPGGRLHVPVWAPYKLYGSVDYVYGFPAWEAGMGFTAAQAILNVVETLGYIWYLILVFGSEWKGENESRERAWTRFIAKRRVEGAKGSSAVLLGFALGTMTASKTILYFLHEYCSDFKYVGHNDAATLILLWIIPNVLWIVLPAYMMYEFGGEILHGLAIASGDPSTTSGKTTLSIKDE